jgi:fructokinase
VAQTPKVTVIGEALVDMVPNTDHTAGPGEYRAQPGGSPYNVAIGLARLGHGTALMARLADNAFGRLLRAHALNEGVDLGPAPHAAEPTTLAIVSLDESAQAVYDFYHEGTADWQWTAAELARLPQDTAVFHLGSIASWTAPGADHIHATAAELFRRDEVLISYDPNVRPGLLGGREQARPLVERCVTAAHVVKTSREDIAWLYPDDGFGTIAARWLALGAALVIVTDGPHGAHLFRAQETPVHRPGRKVRVADTVGAGDSFTAGLLGALIRRELHTPDSLRHASLETLAAAADDAILVSSLTCERIGADPPVALSLPEALMHRPLTPDDLKFRDLL